MGQPHVLESVQVPLGDALVDRVEVACVYDNLLVAELFLEEDLGCLRYGGVLGSPDVRDIEGLAAATTRRE